MTDELPQLLKNLTVQVLSRVQEATPHLVGEPRGQAILITSARPGEGKTIVAEALARHAVQLTGSRVLLVDANPDHPVLHQRFDLPPGPGLIDILAGRASVDSLICVDVAPGLDVLPFGDPSITSLVLRPERRAAFFASVCSRYDLVILDGSILQMAARSLLSNVLGAVVVIDASSTRREVVSGTLGALHVPREKVLGVVLNRRPQYIPRFLYRLV